MKDIFHIADFGKIIVIFEEMKPKITFEGQNLQKIRSKISLNTKHFETSKNIAWSTIFEKIHFENKTFLKSFWKFGNFRRKQDKNILWRSTSTKIRPHNFQK